MQASARRYPPVVLSILDSQRHTRLPGALPHTQPGYALGRAGSDQ
jgi:hypothetical protein